jgi:DNA-binding NarL/FixJ family response regulator
VKPPDTFLTVTDATPRVVVVDDHDLYRSGLVAFLRENRFKVVAEASSGPEAVEATLREQPDAVLMDINLPGFDGVEAVRRISATSPEVQVVMLTVVADEPTVISALMAGASGYVLKDSPMENVAAGVRSVLRGESVLSPRVARTLVRRLHSERQPPARVAIDLTDRERQVLAQLAAGRENAQIATALFISQNTVKTHVSNILAKLGVGNRVQAVVRAYQEGLLEEE